MDQTYTTGHVARICQVSPAIVTKWFDSGKLGGYRTPHGERRIPRASLVSFLEQYGLPLDGLFADDFGLVPGFDPLAVCEPEPTPHGLDKRDEKMDE